MPEASSLKKEVETCMEEEQVVSCVTKMVQRHDGDECGPKLVLLVQPDCEPCKKAQEEFANEIKAGLIEQIPFDSSQGMIIIKENKIEAIPTLVLIDCHGKAIV